LTLREKLQVLANLQKVDMEIAALRKAGEVYPKQLADLEKELAAAKAQVDSERERLLDIERQKRSLEQNISDEKEKVKKWEARLAEQRSTREYAALAREIDIAKKANQTMAEELVELGKTQVQARETVKVKEQEFAGRQDQIGGKMAELKKKLSEVDSQAKELESKRGDAAKIVDSNLLRRYEAIRKKKLPALAAVTAPGTCGGCRMNVPPQLYNTLRSTLGTDVCPSCNRIIYAQEALDAPPAK
jgi:uncharacterized protein